jgi:hypothetical protein
VRRHTLGLVDVEAVPTTDARAGKLAMTLAVASGGICALNGQVGSGKTFAAISLHDELAAAGQRVLWLQMTRRLQERGVLYQFYKALLGCEPGRGSGYVLLDEVVDCCLEQKPVVFIDEAHLLGAEGLQTVRSVHQRVTATADTAKLPLILIGSELLSALGDAPELEDRVTSRHTFTRLSSKELLPALHAWHPMLKRTEPATLREADETYCEGRWRAWARLLSGALAVDAKQQLGYMRRGDLPMIAELGAVNVVRSRA